MQQKDLPALVVMRMITSFPSSANWTACIWTVGGPHNATNERIRLETIARDEVTGSRGNVAMTQAKRRGSKSRLSVASCRKSVTSARSLAREASLHRPSACDFQSLLWCLAS